MFEMNVFAVYTCTCRNSSCVCIKSYAYKRNVDHVNSQLSQPLKCLRICDQCLKMTTGKWSPYIATVKLLHLNEFAYLK